MKTDAELLLSYANTRSETDFTEFVGRRVDFGSRAALRQSAGALLPMLDDALGALRAGERDAVLLRFFEGRGFAEIGNALKMSEDAARMRVTRAVEKMRA
jgi:DNA-directed RNA polymerase specialized sigma24 family protein